MRGANPRPLPMLLEVAMNRTAAERRHHRERVIRNRTRLRENVSWQPEHPGMLNKDHAAPGISNKMERPKGSYIVPGVTRAEWWDEVPDGSTRQILKRDLRQQLDEYSNRTRLIQ